MNEEFVKQSILRMCIQPRSFGYILRKLDGLDPIVTREALTKLERDNKVVCDGSDLWRIREEAKALTLDIADPDPQLYLKKYMGHFDFLKTPHPLDYEWRNTTTTLNHLTELILENNSIEDTVLLLGMPTLFAYACQKDIPQRVTLIESNGPIVGSLQILAKNNSKFHIIKDDIFQTNPNSIGAHHCVFVDPPWYPPHFRQFIWLAARAIKLGGILYISIPPINTRPNIAKERLEWFEFCQQQGLHIQGLYPGELNYAMPFFEFNALRAAGIKGISPFWRRGDLVVFRKISKAIGKRPVFEMNDSEWKEKEIDGVRIRVRLGHNERSGPFKTKHLVTGDDILPTVSSRDRRRAPANVWTSGNRI